MLGAKKKKKRQIVPPRSPMVKSGNEIKAVFLEKWVQVKYVKMEKEKCCISGANSSSHTSTFRHPPTAHQHPPRHTHTCHKVRLLSQFIPAALKRICMIDMTD